MVFEAIISLRERESLCVRQRERKRLVKCIFHARFPRESSDYKSIDNSHFLIHIIPNFIFTLLPNKTKL